MKTPQPLALFLFLTCSAATLIGADPTQVPALAPSPKPVLMPWQLSPEERKRIGDLSEQDHAEMMAQLGITKLRPGKDGSGKPGAANPANYDEAQANPYPDYPDPLTFSDGRAVTTAQGWWRDRRPQIIEAFENEVVGRIPAHVPAVSWHVVRTLNATVAGRPVLARQYVGNVDNSGDPAISVEIKMAVVIPSGASGPVPVLIMFGFGTMPDEPLPSFGPPNNDPANPPSMEQLIADGWGYVSLNKLEHPGGQWGRPHRRHHRTDQPGAPKDARAMGSATRMGMGG